ncbi:MAG: MarR family winged helix-turn-helix transcriptional regulator [Alphaproteobacteria bacterium]
MTISDAFPVLVNRLSRVAHAMQFSHGLNPAQWEALRYLNKANRYSASPSAMADYLGATKGTVSQTLIALESKGLVRRDRCPNDRRAIVLALTDAGREMLAQDPLCQIYAATEKVPEAERQQLAAVMKSILDDLCVKHNSSQFGVCGDCCHLGEGNCAGSGTCGVTGDPLETSDLDRICIDFSPCSVDKLPSLK